MAFTVKWCALCRGYEPEFAKVASAFAGAEDPRSRTPLVFGAVDVDVGDNRRLAKTLGVQSALRRRAPSRDGTSSPRAAPSSARLDDTKDTSARVPRRRG